MSDENHLDHLIRLRMALERILRPYNERPHANENLKMIGFTQKEKIAWARNEPDFQPRRPPDKLPVYHRGWGSASGLFGRL